MSQCGPRTTKSLRNLLSGVNSGQSMEIRTLRIAGEPRKTIDISIGAWRKAKWRNRRHNDLQEQFLMLKDVTLRGLKRRSSCTPTSGQQQPPKACSTTSSYSAPLGWCLRISKDCGTCRGCSTSMSCWTHRWREAPRQLSEVS